uniref:ribosomal protein L9 n=1 Tax=Rhodospora sordida TaxID=362230 RepID=UPI001FCE1285|nr:ribosomal protein L9 [Rhodospora sordida]UNJ15015.1 ribosomal protein L9 [Rhodospora sordida]
MSKTNITVLLKANIKRLGKNGALVKVKPGYARNYLVPKNLAIFATLGVIKQATRILESEQKKEVLAEKSIQDIKMFLEQVHKITFKKKIGKHSSIFGTVTEKEIATLLSQIIGRIIDKKQVEVSEIKTTGKYIVKIKLNYHMVVNLELYVLPTIVLN